MSDSAIIDKVALCFIVSYECGNLIKEKIWEQWINENSDIINVYVHYRDKSVLSPFLLSHAIPEKYACKTSYYHMVPAYMTTIAWAFINDMNNQWFCILTESCIPIISPKKFRENFEKNKNKSIMKWNKAPWNVNMHKKANLYKFNPHYHLWNEPWITLSRLHADICMQFVKYKFELYTTICSGGLANESIFAIILLHAGEISQQHENSLLNTTCSIQDWGRTEGPTHPYTFKTFSDMEYIISKKNTECTSAMFARKIADTFPDSCIYTLCDMEKK